MKYIQTFEGFVNESLVTEQNGDKLFIVANFIFDDKSNAEKYIDILKKTTFEYNSGDTSLYSNGPLGGAFTLKETDFTRVTESLEFQSIDNKDIEDYTKTVLSGILDHFSAQIKSINKSSIVLQLYCNHNSTGYPVPGSFFNEDDAKAAADYVKANAIGYVTNDSRFDRQYEPIEKVNNFYTGKTPFTNLGFLDSKAFQNLAKAAGVNIDFDDFSKKINAFSKSEMVNSFVNKANAANIEFTIPPKENLEIAQDLRLDFASLKDASRRYKLTGSEIFDVFMYNSSNSNPEIVGWSSDYSYSPRNIFWIAVRCKSGLVVPIEVTPNTTGNKVDFWVSDEWCVTQNPNVNIRDLNLGDSQSSDIRIMLKKLKNLIKAM